MSSGEVNTEPTSAAPGNGADSSVAEDGESLGEEGGTETPGKEGGEASEEGGAGEEEGGTSGEEGGETDETPAVVNTRFVVRADINLDENIYAITEAEGGAIFACGEEQLYIVTEEGAETYTDASCDAVIVMGNRVYFNSRTNGLLYHLALAENSNIPEPVGNEDIHSIRNLQIYPNGESNQLIMAQGMSGLKIYDSETNTVEDGSDEAITALHVSVVPEMGKVIVGTPDSVVMMDGGSTEILSGASDMGWLMGDEDGGVQFVTVNPLGFSVMSASGDGGSPTLHSTLSPGAQPFIVREGVASSWSELLTLEWNTDEEGTSSLVVTGRFSQTYSAPGRTVHRHFVDVLDRKEDTVIAAYDRGVMWFDLETQFQEPDIHAKNLVLKMSPSEVGGPATVLGLIQNRGEAPLEITDISIDNPALEWSVDSNPGEEEAPDDLVMTIAPGDSGFFEVQYAGGNEETVGRISISSNDPDEPEYELTARVNFPNVSEGHEIASILVPDASGKIKSLSDWSGKVIYAKLFNGL
jgi:hypothetical protein